MATKDNQSTGEGSTGAGMQVSGEEIFQESDAEVHHVSEADVQAAFGGAQNQPAGDNKAPTTKQPTGSGDKAQPAPAKQGGQPQQPAAPAEPTEGAKAAAANVGEILRGNTAPATEAVKDAYNQVKGAAESAAGQAYEQVQEKAGAALDKQKHNLTEGLTSVANSIRSLGDNLRESEQAPAIAQVAARYSDTAAAQVEQLAHYFETRDLRHLSSDIQGFARRNPTIFVAGAFTLGLLAARFFKSSPRQELVRGDYYKNDLSGDYNR